MSTLTQPKSLRDEVRETAGDLNEKVREAVADGDAELAQMWASALDDAVSALKELDRIP